MSGEDVERLERELVEAQRRVDAAMKVRPRGGNEAFAAAFDEQLAAERALAAARGEARDLLEV